MKRTRSLVSIDTEATGPKPDFDRVIEVGLVVYAVDGSRTPLRWLINPGCPIPAESTAVHHITDAHVANAPRFEAVAAEIAETLRNVDVTGFNLRGFDLPILRREFQLAGVAWPIERASVVDSFFIHKDRQRHTLGNALRFYCGRELVGAHGAVADAEAALDVLLAQLAYYPELTVMDLAALDVESGGRRPDYATELGHLRWKPDGDLYIAFGKHDGRRLVDMDDGFLRWIVGKDFPEDVKAFVWSVRYGDRPRAPNAPTLPAAPVDSDDPDDHCDDWPDASRSPQGPTLPLPPVDLTFDDIPF